MSDPSYGLIMLLKTVNSASNQRSISDREKMGNVKQSLYNKRTLHDPPVKEKEVEENIFLINSHYESSKTDFANEGVSVVARKKRPRRQLPNPLFLYSYTKAKLCFVESVSRGMLVNSFAVFSILLNNQ